MTSNGLFQPKLSFYDSLITSTTKACIGKTHAGSWTPTARILEVQSGPSRLYLKFFKVSLQPLRDQYYTNFIMQPTAAWEKMSWKRERKMFSCPFVRVESSHLFSKLRDSFTCTFTRLSTSLYCTQIFRSQSGSLI